MCKCLHSYIIISSIIQIVEGFYSFFIKQIYGACKVYNLLMKRRVENKRTNLGKIYFEKTYINKTITVNANTT
jgi:hypothetical protein